MPLNNRYHYRSKNNQYTELFVEVNRVAVQETIGDYQKGTPPGDRKWDYTIKDKNISIFDKRDSLLNEKEIRDDISFRNIKELPIFQGSENTYMIVGDEFFLGYQDENQLSEFIAKYNLEDLLKNNVEKVLYDGEGRTKFKLLSLSRNEEIDFFQLVEETKNDDWISSLEPNFTIIGKGDDKISKTTGNIVQSNLDLIDAYKAWKHTTGNENIIIAILDIGVSSSHESLNGKIVPGWNTFNDNYNTQPGISGSHGTACAGIIAGSHNVGKIKGIAPDCKIMPFKVAETSNSNPSNWVFTTESLKNGIIRAYEKQASILNLSFWHPKHDAVSAAIDDATIFGRPFTGGLSNGCLVVGAAGNAGKRSVDYPANLKAVMAVSATDAKGTFKVTPDWGSNYGPEIEISAPGELNYSCGSQNDSDYILFEGTSSSAAIVSGVAALVLSLREDLSLKELKGVLLQSPKLIILDDKTGSGLINAERAVNSIISA